MSETAHDLHSEFPQDRDILHDLKMHNEHFRALAQRYHVLDKAITRSETGIEPVGDAELEDMKKKRLTLLDEVSAMIAAQRQAA